MNKEIYILGGREAETYETFQNRVIATAAEVSQLCQPVKSWVTLTETPPPALSVIPFKKGKLAAFTLFREEPDYKPCKLLTEMEGFRFACRVEEALPVEPVAQPVPFLRKPAGDPFPDD